MAYLATKRNKFLVRPDGAAEIRVELVSEVSSTPRIWLQCVSCGDEMGEHPGRNLFECPECGLDVTFKELDVLGRKTVATLYDRFGLPDGYKKKGFVWRFLDLFGRSKRLPAPKS